MAAPPSVLGEQLGMQLMHAAKIIEEQVEAEMSKMENLDEDDLESIRRRRLEQVKKMNQKKQEMLCLGHGKYEEMSDEKEFFEATKKSVKVVCHFYTDSSFRCKIVDKHLEILAGAHVGTRFIKINAERAKFLSTRLNIRVIPTICVIMEQQTTDYIRGFDDLGGTDEFKTEVLEARLAKAGAVTIQQKKPEPIKTRKTIRGKSTSDSDDDY